LSTNFYLIFTCVMRRCFFL